MLATSFGVEFSRTVSKFRKRIRSCCLEFPSSTKREIWHFNVVVVKTTDKKCTKKRDARAKLWFCQSEPVAFLPFSLTSPSSLLKLPTKRLPRRREM